MPRRFTSILTLLLLLSACGLAPKGASRLPPAASCGNAICESSENTASCPQDCSAALPNATIKTTYITSDGSSGKIAVMIASPKVKRFSEGAGVVVVVPPIFSPADGFTRDPDLASLGLVQVSFLWPGDKDQVTQVQSGGDFDHGGPYSIKVLRDVVRFAGGRIADVNGRYLFGLTSIPPLTDELGVYAFGDAGLAVVKAMSLYGDQFQGLQYFVGRENPTLDSLASEEIGYYDAAGKAVYNPLYIYPTSYSFDKLSLTYTNLRWDPSYAGQGSGLAGRPYLDLDGNGRISGGDFIFDAGHLWETLLFQKPDPGSARQRRPDIRFLAGRRGHSAGNRRLLGFPDQPRPVRQLAK